MKYHYLLMEKSITKNSIKLLIIITSTIQVCSMGGMRQLTALVDVP